MFFLFFVYTFSWTRRTLKPAGYFCLPISSLRLGCLGRPQETILVGYLPPGSPEISLILLVLHNSFSSKGPGNLVRVHGIINSMKYQDILNLNMAAPARKLKSGRHWIFQQDNDPKLSKSTHKWLTEHNIKLLPWPSPSPDLNPIENLWTELKRRMQKRGPQTLDDLERFCKEKWSQIPFSVFYNLIRCYGRRLLVLLWQREDVLIIKCRGCQ